MPNKLKPCPFCGSKNLYYQKPCHFGSPGVVLSSVCCCNCSAEVTGKGNEAVNLWNRRAEDNDVSKN